MKKYTRIRWKRVETNPDNRKKDKYKYILFAGIFELLRVELISRFRALLQLRAKTKGNKRQDTTPTKNYEVTQRHTTQHTVSWHERSCFRPLYKREHDTRCDDSTTKPRASCHYNTFRQKWHIRRHRETKCNLLGAIYYWLGTFLFYTSSIPFHGRKNSNSSPWNTIQYNILL